MSTSERDSDRRWLREAFDRASHPQAEHYVLRLYLTGMTPRSARALTNLRAICDEYLEGRHDLEVVDIYQQVERLSDDQIVAAPTLVKLQPPPVRRIVGDMSDRGRVLDGLGVAGPDGARG